MFKALEWLCMYVQKRITKCKMLVSIFCHEMLVFMFFFLLFAFYFELSSKLKQLNCFFRSETQKNSLNEESHLKF